jgi:hypothetical protein
MPHAEIKYSEDLMIDAPAILAEIEQVILRNDDGSGECKGRAYPALQYHHSHMLVSISMLTKAHRDAAFTQKLMADLETAIRAQISQRCFFSLGINYTTESYLTTEHDPKV